MGISSTRVTWLIAGTVAIALVSTLVYRGSYAAFSATTSNTGNTWSARAIALSDDDGGSAMFTVPDLLPGDSGAECITVTYDGEPPDAVRLYASVGETDGAADGALLDDNLNLTVTYDADMEDAFGDCTGFSSDGTIETDSLADIGDDHSDFASGLALSSGGGAWQPSDGETRTFRFSYTLNLAAPNQVQGDAASATFTWEAQAS